MPFLYGRIADYALPKKKMLDAMQKLLQTLHQLIIGQLPAMVSL
jgi:hypothetical protein